MWRSASICSEVPRRRRSAARLAAVLLLAAHASRARAQGSVTGQLAIIDGPKVDRNDVHTAVVYLEPRGATARTTPIPDELRATSIAMTQREFVPHVRAVMPGAIVTFPNRDPFSHNVFSNAEPGAFDLGLYRRNVSKSASFAHVGVYPVYCNIHSRMTSFVVAVPSALVVYPHADGRFAIPDVPPGTYVLHAWHERAGSIARQIVVPATGLDVPRVVLDARAYVPAPHLNKFGLPYAATRSDRY